MTSQSITLGGGCFWCLDAVYVNVRGVQSVESGYCNGQLENPSYEQVCTGQSGHAEVVQLVFDSDQISLREILEIFFVVHDPTTLNAQGHDHGSQYRSGIYTHSSEQSELALALVQELMQCGVYARPIVTEVLALHNYWPAESYHQDFFAKHPAHAYCQAVAAPKVAKFRKTFLRLQR